MKKRMYILIIILILIFIILSFYKSKSNIFNDIIIFNLWNDTGKKDEYVINPKKEENIKIDVFQTIQNEVGIYKKIAPGSYGNFTIKLVKPEESNYRVTLENITSKPQNLIFILDGKKYNTIEEMQENINIIFKDNDTVTINWQWPYEFNQNEDVEDTKDGENAQKYIFEIKALIE